jgi:4-carboxymuconolactone decarboxylase
LDHEEILRKLAIRDDDYVEWILTDERHSIDASHLDPRTHALVRIAALIASDAAPPSYLWPVQAALRHGALADEIAGILIAVLPAIGSVRVVSAAPKLGLALGYDVADGLERPPVSDPYGA